MTFSEYVWQVFASGTGALLALILGTLVVLPFIKGKLKKDKPSKTFGTDGTSL